MLKRPKRKLTNSRLSIAYVYIIFFFNFNSIRKSQNAMWYIYLLHISRYLIVLPAPAMPPFLAYKNWSGIAWYSHSSIHSSRKWVYLNPFLITRSWESEWSLLSSIAAPISWITIIPRPVRLYRIGMNALTRTYDGAEYIITYKRLWWRCSLTIIALYCRRCRSCCSFKSIKKTLVHTAPMYLIPWNAWVIVKKERVNAN